MSKTQKKLILSFLLSIVCGVFLALVKVEKVFSPAFPAFYISAAVCLLILAAAAYLVSAGTKKDGFDSILVSDASDWNKSYTKPIQIVSVISAFLIMSAAVRIITDSALSALPIINSIFLFACAVSIIMRTKNKEITENTGILSLFPIFYLCLYVLMFYRDNAKEPPLDSFGAQCITLSVLIFAAYFNSAVKFGKRSVFFRYLVTFFAFTMMLCDTVSYLTAPQLPQSADPFIYLPIVCGFTLFYSVSVFAPPVILFDLGKKNISGK